MIYDYEKELPFLFDLEAIKEEVATSDMENKEVLWCRYDSADAEADPPVPACLKVSMNGELIQSDKTKLDGIVAGL